MRITISRPGSKIPCPVPVSIRVGERVPVSIQYSSQRRVEACIDRISAEWAKRLRMPQRAFLESPGGMAAAFAALNEVHGELFSVDPVEISDPGHALSRAAQMSKQFIFDVQTHFVSPAFDVKYWLALRLMGRRWNPELKGERLSLDQVRFENYVREVFAKSDTKMAVLTSAPDDDIDKWLLDNEQMAHARERVNRSAGKKILYCHALVTPHHHGWKDEVDRCIVELKPDAWKCYTTGAPFSRSNKAWRLDDEKLIYPVYEKMVRAGITNVCVHKGLLPPLHRLLMPDNWRHAMLDDLPRAARDWPQLNFIIYHSGLRKGQVPSRLKMRQMDRTGYIPWVSELAAMPARYGVRNVYAEIGSTFALTAVSRPRYCAAILGTLIKGLGAERVLWGTDSIWYGSPQWQIEALRRIEIPEDLRYRFGWSRLGEADGEVKRKIFGSNAALLYGVRKQRGFGEKAA